MKLKQLRSILDGVETFNKPNVKLEQYPTPPDIAAEMLHHIWSQGDIEHRRILDLGCGGGILSIGSAMLKADDVTAVDIDLAALEICHTNIDDFELVNVSLLQADVKDLSNILSADTIDTVIMNPPFGTRCKGADLMFVEIAAAICPGNVYSLHKTSTREHLIRKAEQRGLNSQVIAELRYNIDRMYSFHKNDSRDVQVDFVRFWKSNIS